jgi:type IV fimbrial biogenesis protein FimT
MTELMVTLGIAAILSAVAAPNVRNFIRNNRLTSGVNDLLHSLQVARTEAIKRQNGNVVVCGSADPRPDNATCSYTSFRGWIVFADTNANWQHELAEPLIERHELLDSSVTIRTDANDNIVSYGPTGFAQPTDAIALRVPTTTMVLCDARGITAIGTASTGRALFIAATGRARTSNTYVDVATTAMPLVTGTCP